MVRIIIICFFLIGCATVKVDHQIESLKEVSYEIKEDITSIQYTSNEQTFINHALSMIDKYSATNITKEDIVEDLEVLKDNYIRVKKIVTDNLEKYPQEIRDRFVEYDKIAMSLDKNIKMASKEEDYISSAKMVVIFSMNVIKAALTLK
jgi:hypothetical protein